MSDDSTAEKKTSPPPYLPWTTFDSFIKRLKETVVPPVIDSSIVSGMAGGTFSSLKSALKFLGLISGSSATTQALRELVKAHGTDTWKKAVGDYVTPSYAKIIEGLDLSVATPTQLDERFTSVGGVTGQVREKGVRFLLSALKEAGVPVSPHFEMRPNRSAGPRSVKRRAARKPTEPGFELDPAGQPPPPGTKVIIVPDTFIVYDYPLRKDLQIKLPLPADLTVFDVQRIHTFLQALPVPM